jgi:hypothetical protein
VASAHELVFWLREMPFHASRDATVLLVVSFVFFLLVDGCGRPPAESSSNSETQKLPFDRRPRSSGVSPSRTLIPSTTKLLEGTPIPIRLKNALSSASSHAGDTFSGTIDEPVIIDGQTLVAGGTLATGRVLEAKPAGSSPGRAADRAAEPGYLRIVLVSLNLEGRLVTIETSSIFAKGGLREERNSVPGAASGASQRDRDRDIAFGVDRRLNFRLAQTVDLR